MPLIKSISGIRGTIGGTVGENLTPIDVVSCATGYATWILQQGVGDTIVIGRDARISGALLDALVVATLKSMGLHVINLGLSTTPTVEIAVIQEKAAGGIILTASHNPKEWNALKFLNHKGEFISANAGAKILQIIDRDNTEFCTIENLGTERYMEHYIERHIELIFDLPLVDVELIRSKSFRIVVDCINSTGAISVVPLLEQLGCSALLINAEMTGDFIHNPEPLPKHLTDLSELLSKGGYDLGIAVDPDVDRLVFVGEDGTPFGEEYTIVGIADYILQHQNGNTVSNLSSTRALRDVTEKHGGQYFSAAVGEVNVVEKMKAVDAVFGGEGNGGVIYPALHYGRDALVGIALFLTHLARTDQSVNQLRRGYPDYHISKQKVKLNSGDSPERIIQLMEQRYSEVSHSNIDGLKLEMGEEWVHMRKSNTEPIIRIYAESRSILQADKLAARFRAEILDIANDS